MRRLQQRFVIDAAEPVFRGHFPGYPILPGVMLLALLRRTVSEALAQPITVRAIQRQRFARPVLPGACVRVEVDLDESVSPLAAKCRWIDEAAGQPVARAELLLEIA